MAVAGYLLFVVGLWGALGQRWWIWPLGIGAALLVAAAGYQWAMTVALRIAGRKVSSPAAGPEP